MGELPLLTELQQKYPRTLLELKSVPGLGANRIKLLAERLNIRSREDLERAIEAGSLAELKGSVPKCRNGCESRLRLKQTHRKKQLDALVREKRLKLQTAWSHTYGAVQMSNESKWLEASVEGLIRLVI